MALEVVMPYNFRYFNGVDFPVKSSRGRAIRIKCEYYIGPHTLAVDGFDKQQFASILRMCGNKNNYVEGYRVHSLIMRSSFRRDLFLQNLLIEMYGKFGFLQDAMMVFNLMHRRNLFSWNIIISAYGRHGEGQEAEQLFWQMQEHLKPDVISWNAVIAAYGGHGDSKRALYLFEKMQSSHEVPDDITFITLLEACSFADNIDAAKIVHAIILIKELPLKLLVGNALINLYGKCGCINEAERIFDRMHERDVISWTAIIAAYRQIRNFKEAFKIFKQMLVEKMVPNKVTFLALAEVSTSLMSFSDAKLLHAHIITGLLESDIGIDNALVNMYGRHGSFGNVLKVFSQLHHPDVITWTALISSYTSYEYRREALQLFYEMLQCGITPTKVTFTHALNACSSPGYLPKGKLIHANIPNDLSSDVVVANSLLNMYSKCSSLMDACNCFKEMPLQSVISWTSMISACSYQGDGKGAMECFKQMELSHIPMDGIALVCVIEACGSLEMLEEGKWVHAWILNRTYFSLDVVVANALCSMYSKASCLQDAWQLFERMPLHDIVSWNTMVSMYASFENGNQALRLFQHMQSKGDIPDKTTIISVLDACGWVAALAEGKEIYASIQDCELCSDVGVINALLNMYSKCGELEDTRDLFNRMPEHDWFSWHIMLASYARHGKGKEALSFFEVMKNEGILLDSVTFVSILSACVHSGMLFEGYYHFVSMSLDHGIVQAIEHHCCMVDLLGRSGNLAIAESLINSMPCQPTVTMWTSVLSARIWINCCEVYS